jgi:hypothetical protein
MFISFRNYSHIGLNRISLTVLDPSVTPEVRLQSFRLIVVFCRCRYSDHRRSSTAHVVYRHCSKCCVCSLCSASALFLTLDFVSDMLVFSSVLCRNCTKSTWLQGTLIKTSLSQCFLFLLLEFYWSSDLYVAGT